MPKVTKAFKAVRPGDVYPTTIEKGEEVTGRLLEIAKAMGAVKSAGAAPENKSK